MYFDFQKNFRNYHESSSLQSSSSDEFDNDASRKAIVSRSAYAMTCVYVCSICDTDSLDNSIIYIIFSFFISGTTLILTLFILEYYSRSSTRISSWLNFFISSDFYCLSESINSAFFINLNCLWLLLNIFSIRSSVLPWHISIDFPNSSSKFIFWVVDSSRISWSNIDIYYSFTQLWLNCDSIVTPSDVLTGDTPSYLTVW